MSGAVRDIAGMRAYVCAIDGTPIGDETSARDVLSAAFSAEAMLIVIPAERLHPDFLRLRTRMAGEFLQKCVNYGRRVAIVGDIATAVAASTALADFVAESNRGTSIWFLRDLPSLSERLARTVP